MSWRFPETKYVNINTSRMQITHILSEANEVKDAIHCAESQERTDEEIADLMHSCETYFRIRQNEGADIHQIFSRVVGKNMVRGYYDD